MSYNIPILIICFKRYEKTLELFNRIKSINPKKLYVAIDGARNEEEKLKVDKVASIFQNVNSNFEIEVRRSEINQGCKYGVYNAINWFFENEEYGIILEDDILPYPQFFPYCEELLEKYKDDKRIACISGWSYFYNKKIENYDSTYYFSHIQSSWGWATWKDRWEMIDLEMKNTKFEDIENNFIKDGLPDEIINYYRWIYDNKICFDTTWDYQFCLSVLMKNNMYCIQPLKNFVKNVGDTDATHTIGVNLNRSEVVEDNFVMKHPNEFSYNSKFDVIRNINTNEYKPTRKKIIENKIRILFDNQVFDLQKFGGISRMYADIKNDLNRTGEFNVDISVETTENEYLKDSYPSGKTNNFLVSEERLKNGDFDIFYPTYFYTDFLKNIGNKPYVMSVHDMIPEIYTEYFSKNDLQIVGKKEMVKYASAIEVPSECTKKDLIKILGVDENKIHVVGRALNPRFGNKFHSKNILEFDYILYVGGRDYYKRFDWFIKHITPFLENHKDIHVVCTGKNFNEREIKLIKQYGLWGRVNTIFADDILMATLYKYAKFFVFSSEYEGFGLPVLESYKMGCIALLNNIEVFREITDNKGTFFDLKEDKSNLSEVAEKIMLLNDNEKKAIVDTQYKILERHSFEKYINNFKDIFRNIINNEIKTSTKESVKPVEKISIITINFNNKKGIKKTIESVVNQTVFNKNIEYIIIDGGSTDGSVNVIEKYKDKLHYYVSEKDNGIYEAMNKGVSHATGEYCLFLNSGDKFCENNVIEQAIPYLEEDVVYGNLMLNSKQKKMYPDRISVDYFSYESLPHPSSFIRTKLLKDNPYKTNYGIISDWIFFRECVARGRKFKHINVLVSDFYLGGASSNVRKVQNEKNRYFGDNEYDYEICVVIPCYNQGKYIKETIDSLKKQIYEDFHCVIVNDGSTDNSEEVILENIKDDKRFEYYKNENHGQSYTRNFGIGKTNSKYILCLDSDDKISTAYIECAVRYLNKHPETSLFYGNALMFYDDGKMYLWSLPKFSYSSIFKMNTIYCSSVYRRKDYTRIGGYDETMKAYEDWDFIIRLLYNNDNVYRTDDIVFYYRRHNDSTDANAKKDVEKYKEYIIRKNKSIYDEIAKKNSATTLIKCTDNDGFYGHIYSLKRINPNVINGNKYIVVTQNGKNFNVTDKEITIGNLMSQYDAVVPKPLILQQTVREHYAINHNIEDLEIVEKIINEKHQEYSNAIKVFLNGNILIPYNMFIMKSGDFKEYTKFVFGVLDEYLNTIDADKLKKAEDGKVGEYLAERLTNAFLIKKYTKMKTFPVIFTEK